MNKTYQVRVFGKAGCDKCEQLNKRLDKLLDKEEWKDFDKQYCDVETEQGIVNFCEAECINPQRIPAFLVLRRDASTGEYVPVVNQKPGAVHSVEDRSRLYQYLGLQTDYSHDGRGTLTPKMICGILDEARV